MSSQHFILNYEKKNIPASFLRWGLIISILGLIFTAIAYTFDTQRALFGNLILLTFLISIGIGATFLIALEYISGAVWSVSFRRISEAFGGVLYILPIIAIPLITNLHSVFHWAHIDETTADELLKHKLPYLNVGFFIARFIIIYLIWLLFYYIFNRNSVQQDNSGEYKFTKYNITLSAIFIPIFAISITLIAVDWLMSLEPHWYSTIFGVYYFSGSVLAALGFATFVITVLYQKDFFPKEIGDDHLYSLGALLFAFTNFWAYIAFSQFLLIWYSNIPEETFWYMRRWTGGWQYYSIALIVIRFLVPYILLLSQPSKTNQKILRFISIWIVFAHFIDLGWLVLPELKHGLIFGVSEIGSLLLCFGLPIIIVYVLLNKKNLIPIKDPKIKRNLEFHL